MSYVAKYVKFVENLPEHDTRYYSFINRMCTAATRELFDDAMAELLAINQPWPAIKTSPTDLKDISKDLQTLMKLCQERRNIITSLRVLTRFKDTRLKPESFAILANRMRDFLRQYPNIEKLKRKERLAAEDAWADMSLPKIPPLNKSSYQFIFEQHVKNAHAILAEITEHGGENRYKDRHALLVENYDEVLLRDVRFFYAIPNTTKIAALNYTMRTLKTAYGDKTPTWLTNLDAQINAYRDEFDAGSITPKTEQKLTDAITAAHKAKKPHLITRILFNTFLIIGSLGIAVPFMFKRYGERKEIGFYKESDTSRALKNLMVNLDKLREIKGENLTLYVDEKAGKDDEHDAEASHGGGSPQSNR